MMEIEVNEVEVFDKKIFKFDFEMEMKGIVSRRYVLSSEITFMEDELNNAKMFLYMDGMKVDVSGSHDPNVKRMWFEGVTRTYKKIQELEEQLTKEKK